MADFLTRIQANQLAFNIVLMVVFAAFFFGHPTMAQDAANTTLVYQRCNGETFDGDGPYAVSVAYVFTYLRDQVDSENTAFPYDYYFPAPPLTGTPSLTIDPPAYCTLSCSREVREVCQYCIHAAYERILASCSLSIGVLIVLGDCYVRYENYDFSAPLHV